MNTQFKKDWDNLSPEIRNYNIAILQTLITCGHPDFGCELIT